MFCIYFICQHPRMTSKQITNKPMKCSSHALRVAHISDTTDTSHPKSNKSCFENVWKQIPRFNQKPKRLSEKQFRTIRNLFPFLFWVLMTTMFTNFRFYVKNQKAQTVMPVICFVQHANGVKTTRTTNPNASIIHVMNIWIKTTTNKSVSRVSSFSTE